MQMQQAGRRLGAQQPRRQPRAGAHRRLAVCAAKQGGSSPWSTGPSSSGGSGGGSSSSGSRKRGGGSSTGKKGSGSSSSKPKKAASKAAAGQGFGPKASAPAAAPLYKLTPPLTPQLLDELSPWQVGPSPAWTTFVGHCEGEWLGQYSAFTPWGGDPEPVWADEGGAYLLHAYSRASEARQLVPAPLDSDAEDAGPEQQQQQEQLDMLVRSTVRSSSISSLVGGVTAAAAAAAGGSVSGAAGAGSDAPAPSPAAADDESEGIAYNQGGSVVFTGGSYSVGPEYAGVDASEWHAALDAADGDEAAAVASLPFATVVVEQALVASGNDRLRLVVTLKLRQPWGQEVDVEVARLLLYREHWYGTAESTGAATARAAAAAEGADSGGSGSGSGGRVLQLVAAHRFDVPIVDVARPQPAGLAGCWNVFVTAAAPMVEENPDTLQDEEVFVYSSREERQQWHVPGLTSSAALGGASAASGNGSGPAASPSQLEDDGSGGSFWLPGGAVATFRMVPPPGDASSNGSSSKGSSSGRGLQVGLHWLAEQGSCLFVERQYGADGELAEVRQGSAVKGGWSGGRM